MLNTKGCSSKIYIRGGVGVEGSFDFCTAYKLKTFTAGLPHGQFLAHLYESIGRAIALQSASVLVVASTLTEMLKLQVKVIKTLYFLNPQMDLHYF